MPPGRHHHLEVPDSVYDVVLPDNVDGVFREGSEHVVAEGADEEVLALVASLEVCACGAIITEETIHVQRKGGGFEFSRVE